MALFEVTPYDKMIYETELRDFLPEKIIDVHTHVYLKKNLDPVVTANTHKTVSWTKLVAEDDSIEDLQETYRLMFPDKDVHSLMFAGGKGSLVKNNHYVSETSRKTGWPALYYSEPTESAEQIEQRIREGGFLGLKSYLTRSPKYIPTKEIRVFDFFPKHQLAKLNEMGAICMLHLPRDARLRDPVNLHQILEIRQEFPNVRLIVAHIGRAYCPEDVGDAFEFLAQEPETMFDFSANCSEYVITEALRHVGPKHMMFGTDMPILRMRCRRIAENGNYVNLVPPGLYGDVSGDSHMREVAPEEADKVTFFAYEELLALKRACETLGLGRQDVEDMLYNNANALIEGARRDIYG